MMTPCGAPRPRGARDALPPGGNCRPGGAVSAKPPGRLHGSSTGGAITPREPATHLAVSGLATHAPPLSGAPPAA